MHYQDNNELIFPLLHFNILPTGIVIPLCLCVQKKENCALISNLRSTIQTLLQELIKTACIRFKKGLHCQRNHLYFIDFNPHTVLVIYVTSPPIEMTKQRIIIL